MRTKSPLCEKRKETNLHLISIDHIQYIHVLNLVVQKRKKKENIKLTMKGNTRFVFLTFSIHKTFVFLFSLCVFICTHKTYARHDRIATTTEKRSIQRVHPMEREKKTR